MLPRYSSGSTYETVIFRRQSLYKQGAKINGSYHTRTIRDPHRNKAYLNGGSRKRSDYEDMSCDQNRNGKVTEEVGKKVVLAVEKDYVRLEPVCGTSVSGNSDPSIDESNVDDIDS